MLGSGRRLRYGKLFLRSLAPSPPPWFSAAAVGGERGEVRAAAAAASPRPDSRAAGQVLSAPGASLAASLLCPAVRLPQCTWGVGGRWAPGSGGGGGCGAGQKQPPIQAAGGPRAPGALRAPGSAMGTFRSSSTAPASCSRIAGATMIAGSLLLVSAPGGVDGSRGRRPLGSRGRRVLRAGRVPGPGLRGCWVRGGGGCERGQAADPRAWIGSLWGSRRAQPDSGMKANCFPCSLAAPGEALEMATQLPAHFRVSPPPPPFRGPHPLGAPPWPPAAIPSAGCGAGESRLAAAAALLQLQCHVGMLLQWESAGPGRAGPENAGYLGASPSERAPGPPPPSLRLGWVGPGFGTPKKEPRDPLSGAPKAPAPSQAASALTLEWGKGRAHHKGS